MIDSLFFGWRVLEVLAMELGTKPRNDPSVAKRQTKPGRENSETNGKKKDPGS
jgi:hypothetical protein